MKPSSGLSAPTASSSRSVTWRASSVTLGSERAWSASAARSDSGTRRSLRRPPCGAMSWVGRLDTGRRRDEATLLEVVEDRLQRLRLILVLGVHTHLGVFGRLVRVRYAGEVGDLAAERLGVEALHVAARELIDGAVHVHLDEVVDGVADLLADVGVGRDGGGDD